MLENVGSGMGIHVGVVVVIGVQFHVVVVCQTVVVVLGFVVVVAVGMVVVVGTLVVVVEASVVVVEESVVVVETSVDVVVESGVVVVEDTSIVVAVSSACAGVAATDQKKAAPRKIATTSAAGKRIAKADGTGIRPDMRLRAGAGMGGLPSRIHRRLNRCSRPMNPNTTFPRFLSLYRQRLAKTFVFRRPTGAVRRSHVAEAAPLYPWAGIGMHRLHSAGTPARPSRS